jgi:hypothetical protein
VIHPVKYRVEAITLDVCISYISQALPFIIDKTLRWILLIEPLIIFEHQGVFLVSDGSYHTVDPLLDPEWAE